MSKLIEVSDETAAIIERKVQQGLFPDAESAIAEAIQYLDDRRALDAKLQVGLDELERGLGIPWNEETKRRILRDGRAAYERGEAPDPDVSP